MVTVLAIDVGSSSVKAAVLVGTEPVGALVREGFQTRYDGVRAEVDPAGVMRAVSKASRAAVRSAVGKPVDVVAISAMSPSWVAMDKNGDALTPIVTHQDRRSLVEARRIEVAVGKKSHLEIAGNRPVPGGISSTTAAWFLKHEKGLMRKARLVGHLQTLLIRQLTGASAMDPSNASFTGLWRTTENETSVHGDSGWAGELCDAVGIDEELLPPVLQGDAVAGEADARGARTLGVKTGTPVLTGVVDTSAAIVLAGAEPGMLINVSGSTDVLAVVTDEPRPSEAYLTRALGVGEAWVSVATIPAAGSALGWARQTLFSEMPEAKFFKLVAKFAQAEPVATSVKFELGLAGSRTSVEQPAGAWTGLRLSTTREEMLLAVINALATESATRIEVLRQASSAPLRRDVLRSGGTSEVLSAVLYRDWPVSRNRGWAFADVPEAGILGLGALASGSPA